MNKFCVFLIALILSSKQVFAYKVYYYDEQGERVYKTIEQKDFAKYKNAPRRAHIRKPRINWEITDKMRARKKTYFYKGKN